MTTAALASTFHGAHVATAPQPLGVPAAAAPQQVIEVLPPMAYLPPRAGVASLPGSYVAPPQAASLPGSYAPPPQAVTPPASVAVQQPMSGLVVQPVVAGGGSYVAPPHVGSFVAPPQTSFVPPVQTASFMAAPSFPQTYSMPQAPAGNILQPPAGSIVQQMPAPVRKAAVSREELRMTTGVPDPGTIDKQKRAYSKRLDDQLRYEEELMKMSQRQQTRLIQHAAEAQKRQACLAIEQQAKQKELELNQQCSTQLNCRQQELQSWKLLLERQASDMHLEYEQRKSTEELLLAQFDAHQKAYQMQAQLAGQHQNAGKAGAAGASARQAPPPPPPPRPPTAGG